MQLTIKARGEHVDVLSHLLAKNPYRLYERDVNGHLVRLFFSHFSADFVETTIFVTPDPIELSRNSARAFDITSYINDREFAVSSIFCTFLRSALGTALNGKPKDPYLPWVDHPFSFEFSFGPLASATSLSLLKRLFEPIGFSVSTVFAEQKAPLSIKDRSSAQMITLKGRTTLQKGIRQLFVLIPVLDDYKHYFIDEKEVDKMKRYGEGWLENHPERAYIYEKALRFKAIYEHTQQKDVQPVKETMIRLNDKRYETIIQKVSDLHQKASVVDLGSGEGKLTVKLGYVKGIKELLAVEPSEMAMTRALRQFTKRTKELEFLQPTPLRSSLFYYDNRLQNKDVIILCEVIEHIEEFRLPKMMKMILSDYRPQTLFISTPNYEYNQLYNLGEGYRHPDHRFEWTRDQFQTWCQAVNTGFYNLEFTGIGEEHRQFGHPTQLCHFQRKESV
ncbi:HEN1 C-terminal domain [Bacillus sp. JCM 19047]|uniref:Small RNA 2'-O-methyltransferase n=1 Tax=Shouchella miscanthi TaxID=2598861 RepID=A0ABU6NFE0_9BACI|nr:methyltransferase domain-containing protein [Shouchella miscanthi]MED4126926.1 methyltransferase domain-containing protein [Shouchella miscanthi]GAF20898.1 HEN1 C-terminal domain [Bacillus sp. JCM 19047]